MKPEKRKQLLLANATYWLAAIVVPPLLHMIPASRPPRVLPLIIYIFLFALAALSTLMWSRALDPVIDVNQKSENADG